MNAAPRAFAQQALPQAISLKSFQHIITHFKHVPGGVRVFTRALFKARPRGASLALSYRCTC